MENATLTLLTSSSHLSEWTDPAIVANCQPTHQRPFYPRQRATIPGTVQAIAGLLFAVTATTSGVQYVDYRREFPRTVSSPIIYNLRRRRGQPLSLREARELTLGIIAATDERLRQERAAEARFLLTPWEE